MVDNRKTAGTELSIEDQRLLDEAAKALAAMQAGVPDAEAALAGTDGLSPLNEYWRDKRERLESLNRKISRGAVVVAHEPLRVGEIDPYLVRHPEMLEDLDPDISGGVMVDGTPVEGGDVPLMEPGGEERFGGRLKGLSTRAIGGVLYWIASEHQLEAIADAVDQDAADQRLWAHRGEQGRRVIREADLQRRIEALVEELTYNVAGPLKQIGPRQFRMTGLNGVLDVEPFLERLGGIFGERAEEEVEGGGK